MLLLIPIRQYLERLVEPRSIADVVLVFLVVYGVLKLLRGTRAAPMAAGIGVFAFLYLLAVYENLTTLEFVLRGALPYIGVAIIVLFKTEIRKGRSRAGNVGNSAREFMMRLCWPRPLWLRQKPAR
jgi:diadenylate cyclase